MAFSAVTLVLLILTPYACSTYRFLQAASAPSSRFVAFAYPRVIGDAVVFSAVNTRNFDGIYSYNVTQDTLIEIMTVENQRIPGTFDKFAGVTLGHGGVSMPSGVGVAFIGSRFGTRATGAYIATQGNLKKLLETEDYTSPDGLQFQMLQDIGVSKEFDVVFSVFTEKRKFGRIYCLDNMNRLRRIVDYNTEVPGLPNVTFDFLDVPVIGNKIIVFFGSRQAVSGEIGSQAKAGLYAYDISAEKLEVIADFSKTFPGTTETFMRFSEADFDGQYVGFVARGNKGTMGVFSWSPKDKTLKTIATTRDGELKSFPQAPAVHGESMAFLAVDKHFQRNLYVWRNEKLHRIVGVHESFSDQAGDESEFVYIGSAAGSIGDDFVTFYGVKNGEPQTSGIFIAKFEDI